MTVPPLRGRRPRLELLESRRLLTVTVDSLQDRVDGDDGLMSLREAIAAATPDETIDFSVEGVIRLDPLLGELVIDRSLSILGPGAERLSIDAGHGPDLAPGSGDGSRVFAIGDDNSESFRSVTLSGLTLTGGDYSGEESCSAAQVR
jgi:hypothetical protein